MGYDQVDIPCEEIVVPKTATTKSSQSKSSLRHYSATSTCMKFSIFQPNFYLYYSYKHWFCSIRITSQFLFRKERVELFFKLTEQHEYVRKCFQVDDFEKLLQNDYWDNLSILSFGHLYIVAMHCEPCKRNAIRSQLKVLWPTKNVPIVNLRQNSRVVFMRYRL